MKLRDLQEIFHIELDIIYGKDEVNSFFYLLTEYFCDISRMELALNPETTITKVKQKPVFDALQRLKNQEPIQYIIGKTEFFGLEFMVNTNTLIPRPETEELVSWIIEEVKEKYPNEINILDIGTGTGCIAISLAKNIPNASVSAVDVSKEALEVASRNAIKNEVDVVFEIVDVLNTSDLMVGGKSNFDIIVSNPPYVRNLEKLQMQPNVLEHEPHLALFVKDENPLEFYDAITKITVSHLKKNGTLFLEINEYLGVEMIKLLKDNNFQDIELKQDVFGVDRMLKGIKTI